MMANNLNILSKDHNSRIAELDGIRGVAILMVILFHFINNPLTNYNSNNYIIKILKYVTYFGWVGVDLFFVLSGFLIGGILLKNRLSKNYFKTFYIRRFLRILPIYFLLLSIFYILEILIGDIKYYGFEKPFPSWSYYTFTQNIFMGIYNHFGSGGITPTWSLAVEEQFYLICPLIIWVVKPKYLPITLISLIVVAPIFRLYSDNWYQSYTWFTSRMDSLAFGVLSAYMFSIDSFKTHFIKYKKMYFGFTALLFFFILAIELFFGSLGVLKHSIFALFFSLLILIPLLLPDTFLAKLLRYKPLIQLGLISYSLYLFHNLINIVFHQVFLHNQKPLLNTINDIYISIIALFTSLAISILFYKFIESPSMHYGKTFKY